MNKYSLLPSYDSRPALSLLEYYRSRFFLQIMGFNWPQWNSFGDTNYWIAIIRMWYIIVRLSMVYFMFHLHIALNFLHVFLDHPLKSSIIELPIIYAILTLQGIVLIPSLAFFDANVLTVENDCELYDGTMKQCYLYFGVTFASVVGYIALMTITAGFADNGGIAFLFADLLVGLSVTCVLTINIFFIVMECRRSLHLVNLLYNSTSGTNLLESYHTCYSQIGKIQKAHELKNNAMLLVALLNVLAALVTLFLQPKLRPNLPENNILAIIGFSCLYMKELFFVALVFFESSNVNEQVDKYYKHIAGELGKDGRDQQRRDILLLLPVRPIAYKLGYVRITKRIFTQSIVGFSGSFFIAFIRLLAQYSDK